MQFEIMRLALLPRAQMDIEEVPHFPPDITREKWLRLVFSREITFIHRREQFHYVPDQDTPSDVSVIAGRIGRKTLAPDHLPPDQGLKDTVREMSSSSSQSRCLRRSHGHNLFSMARH